MKVLLVLLAIAAVVVWLSVRMSRRSPARLSREGSDRATHVVERPAGPDAEAMGVDEPGRPTTAPPPHAGPSDRPPPDRPPPAG